MLTCLSCGTENPTEARFCLNCGTALSPTSRRKERKFATAVFADLVGSTSLAEREDPEVVQSLVGRTFDRLAEEVERYGGLLEKFMGDAILAVFGVPKSHEDDPERAVRTALEMQAILSELNRGFVAEGRVELAMRIGVEAGEVLVDLERAHGPRDRMLTGDAVNTAARLQTACEPGHVVVGPSVYAATKDVFDYRELEPLDLKGKADAVLAWEALRIKARRRGERPSLGLEARLIGRDEELTMLKQTLHRVESDARPSLVTIVGPAGAGKSRLVQELANDQEGRSQIVYWRSGRCLAYGNTSYSALADAIKAQCEILEDDAAEVAARKADAAVIELFGDDEVAAQIRVLVGGGASRSFGREELFEGWRRFLERMAARYPLVLVLEDIHWADAGLLDFIDHVVDWAQGPILLVTLARPELFDVRPTWGGGKRNATSIYLDPLSEAEGIAMIDDLLPGEISDDTRRLIVERSEGNPLYTEEIVRTLIDNGVLRATEASRWEEAKRVEDFQLPRSIQGLIAARLDGLPDDEKGLLQDAAVIGRVFWAGAVERLSGRDPSEVGAALGRLRVKELVVPHESSSFSGENEYAFRHNLIRDGAYDSLPKSLRAEKHGGVARWAAERAGDRADEIAELLATHDVEALRYLDELGDVGSARDELMREGYRWSRAAGDRARKLWQQSGAVGWYREALRLSAALDAPVEERASIARALAHASWGTTAVDVAVQAAELALALFEEAGDEAGAGWADARIALAVFTLGDDERVVFHSERAIARLESAGDSEDLSDALCVFGRFRWRRGDLDAAEPLLRRGLEIARRIGSDAHAAQSMHWLGLVLLQRGRLAEGLPMVEESFRLGKEAGDFDLVHHMYNNVASVLAEYASDYPRAKEILEEGIEIARKAGARHNLAWQMGSLGDVLAELGRLPEAEEAEREALEMAEEVADEPLIGMRTQFLGQLRFLRGDLREADELYRRAEPLLRQNPEPQSQLPLMFLAGALAQAKGDVAAGVTAYAAVREQGRESFPTLAAQASLELARLLVRAGRTGEATGARIEFPGEVPPAAAAFAAATRGVVADDAQESVSILREAVGRFESVGQTIELARCLLDLGRELARSGEDPVPTYERARELLVECDAQRYVPEAEKLIVEASA
jgi:class 3 adenylate cyclase/tetratricopeptide (TPR) repeat protein/nicotinamide riboside kinase